MFFVEVADQVKSKLPKVDGHFSHYLSTIDKPAATFKFEQVTYVHVRDIIDGFKNKTCRDYYGLNIVLIKSVINQSIVPLTKLFNECSNKGQYPEGTD